MVVDARWAGLIISDTSDLLGFLHITISMIYIQWVKEKKMSNERYLYGHKRLNVRREWADLLEMIKRTVAQTKTLVTNIGLHDL